MYIAYYGIHLGTPQPDPPNIVALISPQPEPARILAMGTPMPIPPSMPVIFVPASMASVTPLPEPPYREMLETLRKAVAEYSKQIDEAIAELDSEEG